MNPTLVETFMAILILSYALMGGIFIANQKRGHTFIASFNKAFVWGSCLFVIGYSLDTAAYVAWA
jgi:hypothetical protein